MTSETTQQQMGLIAKSVYDRIVVVLQVAIARWEERVVEDPNYQPSPSDLVSIMALRRHAEEMLVGTTRVDELLRNAKVEIQELEARLLGLLTAGGDDDG